MINLDDFLPASDKFQYRIGTPDVHIVAALGRLNDPAAVVGERTTVELTLGGDGLLYGLCAGGFMFEGLLSDLECAGMKPGDKCTVSMQVLSGHEIRKQLRLKPLEDGYIDP